VDADACECSVWFTVLHAVHSAESRRGVKQKRFFSNDRYSRVPRASFCGSVELLILLLMNCSGDENMLKSIFRRKEEQRRELSTIFKSLMTLFLDLPYGS